MDDNMGLLAGINLTHTFEKAKIDRYTMDNFNTHI